jgi:hypothetical protein
MLPCRVQQCDRAEHVRAHEGQRIADAAVHMAFSREVDDAVDGVVP